MSTAALFTTAKTWMQPKCPLTNEWIKKMWYIHAKECYSAIKKNNNGDFPGGPGVKTPGFYCGATGSIPGWGTKIPYATWCSQKI